MVDLHHVVELHEQHLATTVAINGHRDALLAVGEVNEFLLDVARAVSADGVLYAAVQQVANIVTTLDNDEGRGGFNVWSARQSVERFGGAYGQHGTNFLDDGL